jgi:hypothetical protein
MTFRQYVEHGWKLCRIREGEKGPRYKRWNYPGEEIPLNQVEYLAGAGLMHAYSGTCAIDIDDIDKARVMFAEHGVDLDALLEAPDSVQISSGRLGRAKLLYALDEPLYTCMKHDEHKAMVFELRCSSRTERTTQDVLPPSIHPKTKKPYEWKYGDPLIGDWRRLPPLPDNVRALWVKLGGAGVVKHEPVSDVPPVEQEAPSSELHEECKQILAEYSADCDYDTWLKLGMMLEHELGADGYVLWDSWSSTSSKYPGTATIDSHWNSFGNSPNPVTINSFRNARVSDKGDFEAVTASDDSDDPFAQAERAPLKLWTLGEIQNRPWPTWNIRDILPQAELSMVYGPSGAGKSFVVLDMSLAVARGVPWVEHDVRQGGVLWLAAEAFGSMKPRTKAYAQANSLTMEQLAELPFYVVEQFNLNDKQTIGALIAATSELSLRLVVVDTLAAASGGANENSGEDMGAILDGCRAIHYATGASVVLIHHSGKNVELGARGWSGIRAAVQAELRVDYDALENTRAITATKQRDGQDGLSYSFTLVEHMVGMDDRELPINSASVKVTGKRDTASAVQGDGNGRRPPKDRMQRTVLEVVEGLIGVGQSIESTDIIKAVVSGMTPPPSGANDNRQLQVRRALDALCQDKYLIQSAGLVGFYDDTNEDGSDLV